MNYPAFLCVLLHVLWLGSATDLRMVSHDAEGAPGDTTFTRLANDQKLGGHASFRERGEAYETPKGVKRQRLVQTYGGYEVYGTHVEAEETMAGSLTGQMYGLIAVGISSDIPDPEACPRNVRDLVDIAVQNEALNPSDSHIENRDGRRVIYVDEVSKTSKIAYRVEFFYNGDDFVSFPAYIISACDDEILTSFNQIQNVTLHRKKKQAEDECDTTTRATPPPGGACNPSIPGVGGNEKIGRITYNQNGKCLRVQKSGNSCTMQNTFIKVVDNGNSQSRSRQTPISFTCSQGHSDPKNGAYGVSSDAMYYGDITGRLYTEKYGFRALSYTVRLVIHYGRCYDNAFWDGRDMYFGDGCNIFYPLVNQDVVTHELGHGITSTNSNLEYRRQSGGINEAFSDISGEVAEVFANPDSDRVGNDWKVGYELFKGERSLRYFINPPDDGRSIKSANDYRDGLDVHYSSGVFNHAFYQLVAIQGMPIFDAYKCFLDANRGIWGTRTNFQEGACGVMQSCYDNGFDHIKVRNAFNAVDINLSSCDYSALSTVVRENEVRENVLVSSARMPILKVSVVKTNSVIKALANDLSDIDILVSTDPGAEAELTIGTNEVNVDGPAEVFVKLSSTSATDVQVALSVE